MAIKATDTITLVKVSDGTGADNLILNGFGLSKDNENFDGWEFDVGDGYNGYPSFKFTGVNTTRHLGNALIPVTISNAYEFNINIKGDSLAMYLGWMEFDIDRKYIDPYYSYSYKDSTTELTKELKNGDTVVYLKTVENWVTTELTHKLGLIFWNYKDSTGHQYSEGEYSRNAWLGLYTSSNVNKTDNTITLNKPWANGSFPIGTRLSQSNSAGRKYFGLAGDKPSATWTHYSNTIKGIQDAHSYSPSRFNPAARYVQFIILHNYNSPGSKTTWINSVSFEDTTLKEQLDESINESETKITNTFTSLIEETSKEINLMVQKLQEVATEQATSISSITNQLQLTSEMAQFIKTTTEKLESVIDGKASIIEIQEWARFDGANLELGTSNSPFKCKLSNTELAFYQGSNKVAWISNNELHVLTAVIATSIGCGNFMFIDEGSLGFSLI